MAPKEQHLPGNSQAHLPRRGGNSEKRRQCASPTVQTADRATWRPDGEALRPMTEWEAFCSGARAPTIKEPAMAEVPPEHLRYTAEHEWIAVSGDTATIGVTAFAAEQLGDIVFVGLPSVGDALTAGSICGELESTKSVSDLYSPVGGMVSDINAEVVDDPALVNVAPFDGGWLFRVASAEVPDGLLTASEYVELTEGGAA